MIEQQHLQALLVPCFLSLLPPPHPPSSFPHLAAGGQYCVKSFRFHPLPYSIISYIHRYPFHKQNHRIINTISHIRPQHSIAQPQHYHRAIVPQSHRAILYLPYPFAFASQTPRWRMRCTPTHPNLRLRDSSKKCACERVLRVSEMVQCERDCYCGCEPKPKQTHQQAPCSNWLRTEAVPFRLVSNSYAVNVRDAEKLCSRTCTNVIFHPRHATPRRHKDNLIFKR